MTVFRGGSTVNAIAGEIGVTADDLLDLLKTVDGEGSGLDADFINGLNIRQDVLDNRPSATGNEKLFVATDTNEYYYADGDGNWQRIGQDVIDTARTIDVQHTIDTGSSEAPFKLGSDNQGQLVDGLNADSVDGADVGKSAGDIAQYEEVDGDPRLDMPHLPRVAGKSLAGRGLTESGGQYETQPHIAPFDADEPSEDEFEADLGGDVADGEVVVVAIPDANTTDSPTLENTGGDPSGGKSVVDVAGNAWAGMLEGRPHKLLYDSGNDRWVVVDPGGGIRALASTDSVTLHESSQVTISANSSDTIFDLSGEIELLGVSVSGYNPQPKLTIDGEVVLESSSNAIGLAGAGSSENEDARHGAFLPIFAKSKTSMKLEIKNGSSNDRTYGWRALTR